METPLLLRPEEAAKMLAISRSQLYRLMQTGELASVHIGTARRVTARALEEFVDRQAEAARAGE